MASFDISYVTVSAVGYSVNRGETRCQGEGRRVLFLCQVSWDGEGAVEMA